MNNEQILEYLRLLAKQLVSDILEEDGIILLDTNDVDAYKDKLESIADIVVSNMIKTRLSEAKEEISKKYGMINPDVVITPTQDSVLNYIAIGNTLNSENKVDDEFVLGIPRDLYEDMLEYYRDIILKIKRGIIPELRQNVLALNETVKRMLNDDKINIIDVILPQTNLYDIIEDKGWLKPTGASGNNKDVRLLPGNLPTELMDYKKVIEDLPTADVKILFEEYVKNFIGWDHIEDDIEEVLGSGVLAEIALNVQRRIKVFELPVTLTLLLMFRSLMDNASKYNLSPDIVFSVKVVYDYLVKTFKLNLNVYNIRVNDKQPIYGIEGYEYPIVYLIGEVLEGYDIDILNAYALYVFERKRATEKGMVSISTVDKIDNIIKEKDKYLTYVSNYNKLKAAKKMTEMKIGLANAYALQLSNNSPRLVEYLSRVHNKTPDAIKNEIFNTAKQYINFKDTDVTEVSSNVLHIVKDVSGYYSSLGKYLDTVIGYDKLVEDIKDADVLTILGLIGIITMDIEDQLRFSANKSGKIVIL